MNKTRTAAQKEQRKNKEQQRRISFWKKVNATCVVCQEPHPLLIDFHHVGTKRWSISFLLSRCVFAPLGNWPALLEEELKQCVPLCVVCHRKLHAGILTLTPEQEGAKIVVENLKSVFIGREP